jgi:hypothetical protein
MTGSQCSICQGSHATPLEARLCSIAIGNMQPVGWCLWCGESVKKHLLFCKDSCRITYMEDITTNPPKVVKSKRRRGRRVRVRDASAV